ncbi:hypothetical protein HPB51_009824 [Rhipicephalus microplus]|uniref:Uncharacterized protein n=1 Tax=Rhipicephalus microplus TaxID=6941 RepID=A0A9J6ESD5_RHIMP|nr:hypothetical protein HPB51_009824 [Rhipicephalus microplus]
MCCWRKCDAAVFFEMPRSIDRPATDQAVSQFADAVLFNSRHDNATSLIEPPYQLSAHRPPARGTQLTLTSPTSAKESCIYRARTSRLGSNASTANAYTPRPFLVQVNNRYSLYASRTRYMAFIVLPSPTCCARIAYECASVVLELLLLAGDIEENPGPPTRSSPSEATSDILQALRDLQTGQAGLLTELKSLRTKLAQNDETLSTITERLGKIEIDCASLLFLMNDIKKVQAFATQNSCEIASLTTRVDDSEDRARRSNLVFFGRKDSAKETWA